MLKYIVLILSSFILLLSSCNKDVKEDMIPNKFTKKVLIEEFGGEWCSFCVDGAVRFETLLNQNPENYIGVSLHYDDPFEVKFPSIVDMLLSKFEIIFFPYNIIDRTTDKEKSWEVLSEFRLSQGANVGIKIKTKIVKKNLDVNIDYISKTNIENAFLTLYVVEDFVPESSSGAQSGGGGNYIHRHVLRQVLTKKTGDPIILEKDKIQSKTFSGIKLGQYDNKNIKIVAFINLGTSKSFEVLNANSAKINEEVGW